MATVSYTAELVNYRDLGLGIGKAYVITWVLSSGNLDGQWYIAPVFDDINVQAYSSDWGGQTLNIQGTNETGASPSNPVNLKEAQRGAIAMTSDDTEQILDNLYQYRPLLGGNPGANLTVKMLFIKKGRL